MDSYDVNLDSQDADRQPQNGTSMFDNPSGQSEQYEEPQRREEPITLDLPEIPKADLSFDFSTFMEPVNPVQEKVIKRASNVMKLTKENEKLQAELKAMAERLEAVERRRAQLAEKKQAKEKQSSS